MLLAATVATAIALTRGQPAIKENPGENTRDDLNLLLVPNMTEATQQALEDRNSVQYMALKWISEDPNWDSFEDWRKQQRFALACIYYSWTAVSDGSFGMDHLATLLDRISYHLDE